MIHIDKASKEGFNKLIDNLTPEEFTTIYRFLMTLMVEFDSNPNTSNLKEFISKYHKGV